VREQVVNASHGFIADKLRLTEERCAGRLGEDRIVIADSLKNGLADCLILIGASQLDQRLVKVFTPRRELPP
jgi:hypothetical protein